LGKSFAFLSFAGDDNMNFRKGYVSRIKGILKKGILISGALARVFIGVGATILLFRSFRKKKAK